MKKRSSGECLLRARVVALYTAVNDEPTPGLANGPPSSMWLITALMAGDTGLADDLIAEFGGAVVPRRSDPARALCGRQAAGREWLARFLPHLDRTAPCPSTFNAPGGWWPPEGPGGLSQEQVEILIDTGNLDALRRAFAEGRLVLGVRDRARLDWCTVALLALRPDIAEWLFSTFGGAAVAYDLDARFIKGRLLLSDAMPPTCKAARTDALEWLQSAKARLAADQNTALC